VTNAFDLNVFHAINHMAGHTPILDDTLGPLAHYGLEIYAVIFVIAWFALPRREEKKRHALVVSAVGGVIALLINAIIGGFVFRPRPFTVAGIDATQLIPHPADTSFPSDHVSGGFGFASAAWGNTARWFSWLFTILSVLMMFARVYVGVHWPTDVLAGLVIGIISGQIAKVFSTPLRIITRLLLKLFRMGKFA
jgi:undecaprenyl-diphosphatase